MKQHLRKGLVFAALGGLLLAGLLVVQQGLSDVTRAVLSVGWGIVPVLVVHAVQVALAGVGWRALHRGADYASSMVFIRARWIRESVNSLLPVALVGGDVVGARLLTLHGMSGGGAGASMVVDLTMEVVSQILFTLLGLALLLLGGHYGNVVGWVLTGLALAVMAVLTFFAAQRRGMFKLVERLFELLAARFPALGAGTLDGLHDSIQALYRDRRALAMACNVHLLAWVLGALEVWLILHFMGAPVSMQQALVLESLGQAVRSAAFLVPGGFGVQEAGFLLLGALYGLPPGAGLALSLVKRVREVAIGLPGMLWWQVLEGHRLMRRKDAAPEGDG